MRAQIGPTPQRNLANDVDLTAVADGFLRGQRYLITARVSMGPSRGRAPETQCRCSARRTTSSVESLRSRLAFEGGAPQSAC